MPDEWDIDWAALEVESKKAEAEKWAKYPPAVKNFYQELDEVAKMPEEEVKDLRLSLNNIMVNHFNEEDKRLIPNPVKSFYQAFHNHPEILAEIERQGFEKPSPIQCQAWPILLQGIDLIGVAQTGTGKTLAYLLPAMIHIENQTTKRENRPGPTALVLAPTRELAQQIQSEAEKYKYRGIKTVCVYGGGDPQQQKEKVSGGVEIVIATPGRLNDFCASNVIDLTSCSYLVLDEADRMLDLGFEPQIRKVFLDIRPDRQVCMMSATWPPGVRRIALNFMTSPFQINVGSFDLTACHSVTQKIIMCSSEEKKQILFDFIANLPEEAKMIVFCGRKTCADDISSDLALKGFNVECIHGSRCQESREQALRSLKDGSVKILIATDVASRGLDIDDITHIFNHDFPRNIEEYVHRIGRTGRAGRSGESISLMTREDWKHSPELIKIMRDANQPVPVELEEMSNRYTSWKEQREKERASGVTRPDRGPRNQSSFGSRNDSGFGSRSDFRSNQSSGGFRNNSGFSSQSQPRSYDAQRYQPKDSRSFQPTIPIQSQSQITNDSGWDDDSSTHNSASSYQSRQQYSSASDWDDNSTRHSSGSNHSRPPQKTGHSDWGNGSTIHSSSTYQSRPQYSGRGDRQGNSTRHSTDSNQSRPSQSSTGRRSWEDSNTRHSSNSDQQRSIHRTHGSNTSSSNWQGRGKVREDINREDYSNRRPNDSRRDSYSRGNKRQELDDDWN